MSKLHSMPMFWAEFFADTEQMTADAAKAYLFLLGHAWIRGAKLPDDDVVLARLARVGRLKWVAIKKEVMSQWFKDDLGFWAQKRLRKEWAFVVARKTVNADNGSRGGQRAAGKRLEISTKETERPLKHPTPTPTLIREDLGTIVPREADASPVVVPIRKKIDRSESDQALLDRITDRWNAWATRHGSAQVERLTKQRSVHCRCRIADLMEHGHETPEQAFDWLLSKCDQSFFAHGAARQPLKFDQLMREGFMAQMIEGAFKYQPDKRRL